MAFRFPYAIALTIALLHTRGEGGARPVLGGWTSALTAGLGPRCTTSTPPLPTTTHAGATAQACAAGLRCVPPAGLQPELHGPEWRAPGGGGAIASPDQLPAACKASAVAGLDARVMAPGYQAGGKYGSWGPDPITFPAVTAAAAPPGCDAAAWARARLLATIDRMVDLKFCYCARPRAGVVGRRGELPSAKGLPGGEGLGPCRGPAYAKSCDPHPVNLSHLPPPPRRPPRRRPPTGHHHVPWWEPAVRARPAINLGKPVCSPDCASEGRRVDQGVDCRRAGLPRFRRLRLAHGCPSRPLACSATLVAERLAPHSRPLVVEGQPNKPLLALPLTSITNRCMVLPVVCLKTPAPATAPHPTPPPQHPQHVRRLPVQPRLWPALHLGHRGAGLRPGPRPRPRAALHRRPAAPAAARRAAPCVRRCTLWSHL
jgi:hypothetical protein